MTHVEPTDSEISEAATIIRAAQNIRHVIQRGGPDFPLNHAVVPTVDQILLALILRRLQQKWPNHQSLADDFIGAT